MFIHVELFKQSSITIAIDVHCFVIRCSVLSRLLPLLSHHVSTIREKTRHESAIVRAPSEEYLSNVNS
jgi:hypothetical protein